MKTYYVCTYLPVSMDKVGEDYTAEGPSQAALAFVQDFALRYNQVKHSVVFVEDYCSRENWSFGFDFELKPVVALKWIRT